jgi:NADH-quinone oxidoreductase subunit E
MAAIADPTTVQVQEIIDRWHGQRSFVIEMLQDVQQRARYLPKMALHQISQATDVSMAQLYHLATFYKAFSLEPRGQHVVKVCQGTACHVQGGVRVMEACCRHLNVEPGGTTPDRMFSVEPVQCLGCCGLAAVMTVEDDLYGHVNSVRVPKILDKYAKTAARQEVAVS